MKLKTIALTALASIMPAIATAQTSTDTDDDTRPLWGVRATFDVNIPGKWHAGGNTVRMYDTGLGGNVGAVCNLYLGKRFYFEPGVMLFYDTYGYHDLVISGEPGQSGNDVFNPDQHKIGVRVPLVVGYTIPLPSEYFLSVYTGPELNYCFSGKIDLSESDKTSMPGFNDSLFGKDGNQRRFDMAWKVGVGFPLGNFTLSVDAAIGVTDLMKGNVDFRENRVSLGLTYYW